MGRQATLIQPRIFSGWRWWAGFTARGLVRLFPGLILALALGGTLLGGTLGLASPAMAERPVSDPATSERPIAELVIVDAALAQAAMAFPLAPHQRMVVVDAPPGQALVAIAQALRPYHHLSALHLMAHGQPGHLYLSHTDINSDWLRQHRADLQPWRSALLPQADLLIYGCEVALGASGGTFLDTWRDLLAVDVAASSTPIGPALLGGNGGLERHRGTVDTPPLPGLDTWPMLLKQITVTSTADHGPGTLREAILQANRTPEDDRISLETVSGIIALEAPLPPIAGNLFLVGNDDDVLSGEKAHRVLVVNQGEVTLQNLTVANGLASGDDGLDGAGGSAGLGGGLLINDGSVTLSTVRFVDNQAVGGNSLPRQDAQDTALRLEKQRYTLNRGAIAGVNGIGIHQVDTLPVAPKGLSIDSLDNRVKANRGAMAGVNGIGVGGIGTIAFAGGGGFGGLGNAGNGGNGGNGGTEGGNGGNGGDGGNGGVGIFGGSGPWGDLGTLGTAAFSGGGGLGGVGNAGNGGRGGNAEAPTASGGNGGQGGNGGNGGFGGGGGAGGWGGEGGYFGMAGTPGTPGLGGFGGGDGAVGLGGGGGGLGGAIFLKAGRLMLHNTVFEHNEAIGGDGANLGQGKGGAIFIKPSPDPSSPRTFNFGKPDTGQLGSSQLGSSKASQSPQVWAVGKSPTFRRNRATDKVQSPTDNADIYGWISVAGGP